MKRLPQVSDASKPYPIISVPSYSWISATETEILWNPYPVWTSHNFSPLSESTVMRPSQSGYSSSSGQVHGAIHPRTISTEPSPSISATA